MDSLPDTMSRLLVAYTIEFDNEVESRLAHRTVESNVVVLTARGVQLRRHHARVVDEVAAGWPTMNLAELLDRKGDIVAALTPPPDGWRANSPYRTLTAAMLEDPANRLPAYPLVTHRGGYPDGS